MGTIRLRVRDLQRERSSGFRRVPVAVGDSGTGLCLAWLSIAAQRLGETWQFGGSAKGLESKNNLYKDTKEACKELVFVHGRHLDMNGKDM